MRKQVKVTLRKTGLGDYKITRLDNAISVTVNNTQLEVGDVMEKKLAEALNTQQFVTVTVTN